MNRQVRRLSTRGGVLRVVLGTVFLGALANATPADERMRDASDERPNIIFIFSDDHGAQAIGAYGSRVNQTPQLDRLARDGMRFANCFVTNAICAPSRAVILTGKHSHLNGQTTNAQRFDGAQQTFPKLLQKAGYQTALIGKWHLKSDPTGFDHWDVLIGQGPYYNPKMIRNGEQVKRTGYTTDLITDLALEWLGEARQAGKPFMLMCQHKAPHRNWQPAPRHLTLFDDITIPEPPTLFDDWSERSPASQQQEMTIAQHLDEYDLKLTPPRGLTDEQLAAWNAAYEPKNAAFRAANLTGDALVRWKYQRYAKDYLRCVKAVDEGVGRILDFVDESGLRDNTIVVYCSDQGWYLGEHGWYDKRWMYEESLRMPLLVRWPGTVKSGAVNNDLVQNLDFAETFLDLAGVPIPNDMQGRSMVPLLKGDTPRNWRKSIYYHYYENPGWHAVPRHYGVRTEQYKLMHFYRLGYWELYDLKLDPDEMENVYNDAAYADVAKKLKTELERLRKKYHVTEAADREYDELTSKRNKK